jgi:hypothetical protein
MDSPCVLPEPFSTGSIVGGKGISMREKAFVGLLLLGFLSVVMAACTIRDASVALGPSVRMLGADFAQRTITIGMWLWEVRPSLIGIMRGRLPIGSTPSYGHRREHTWLQPVTMARCRWGKRRKQRMMESIFLSEEMPSNATKTTNEQCLLVTASSPSGSISGSARVISARPSTRSAERAHVFGILPCFEPLKLSTRYTPCEPELFLL